MPGFFEGGIEMSDKRIVKTLDASKGGKARAERLSPEERQEIARQAAAARWSTVIPQATHTGTLTIGNTVMPCAVLEDGTRVLTQQGFLMAIGRSGKPAKGRGSQLDKLAPFLNLNNLKPFVDQELAASTNPVIFRVPSGSRAYGYRAEMLPRVCEVYLQARDRGALLKSQERFAKACEILMRGLAHVGIIALVDEATGYQYDRARHALEKILELFISKELLKWAKTFPDEFYTEMFRLKDWQFSQISSKRPRHVGKLTNDLIYERLAPGVLEELKRITPRNDSGRPKHKYHQRLTEDVGHPRLREHLSAVLALMRASDTWDGFYRALNRSLPRQVQSPVVEVKPVMIGAEDNAGEED